MFFLQQLGYLVFLQVSSTLFSIFSVPRVPWAYFCFSLRLLLIAVRDRSAPEPVLLRNELFSVYGPGPFGSGSQVLFKNKYWCMWSGTVWLWDPVLCLKRIFCWFVSGSRFFLLFRVKYHCMRSGTALLRDPVLVIYTVRDRFALGAG